MLHVEWDAGEFPAAQVYEGDLMCALQAAADAMAAPMQAQVFVAVTDDCDIQGINREHRGVDSPTDVLSFPLIAYPLGQAAPDISWEDYPMDVDPETGRIMLGDIIISWPAVARQAAEYGHDERRELCYLAVHGLAHLLGFDHENNADKARMRAVEDAAMEAAGIGR